MVLLLPDLSVEIPDETLEMREFVRESIASDSKNDEWSYDHDDGDFELETMETVY